MLPPSKNQLPPRARLTRLASALGKHLPIDLATLIDATHFDAERPALLRLADPAHARAAAEAMTEPEAAWLAELLHTRWAAIAKVELDPIAAICAPEQIWLGSAPASIDIGLAVDGIEPNWRARWDGPLIPETQREARSLTLELRPTEHPPADVSLHVSIDARAAGARILLTDSARVPIRVPQLILAQNRRQLLVRDQRERPAANTRVTIANVQKQTDGQGMLQLDQPLPPGVEIRVEEALAGCIPETR
jgi:hypothetical protein